MNFAEKDGDDAVGVMMVIVTMMMWQ